MRIGVDLDGTLISCKEKHVCLMASLLKAYNIKINMDVFWALKRKGFSNIKALNFFNLDNEVLKKINNQWVDMVENLEWLNMDKPLDGVFEFLSDIRDSKSSLHLISARNNVSNALIQIKSLNLYKYFDTVSFINIKNNEKKSDIFFSIGIDVYIGDTEYDYVMCVESNVKSILVSTGMRDFDFCKRFNENTLDRLPIFDDIKCF